MSASANSSRNSARRPGAGLLFVAVFLATLALAASLVPALAQERILSFSSDITLLTNGTVDVTETITVRAEGNQIKRGIFRDIPTTLTNRDGSTIRSNLKVISVSKNWDPEPFFTEGIRDGTRIYIGDADVFLTTGTYRYTIRYTMTRMARYFEEHDELYWNATGNFWDFPIEKAVARVTLPKGAVISELAVYTGRQGENGADASVNLTSDNTATFRATRPFNPREGMSVVALFQKGILVEPDGTQKALNFLSDHRKTIFPLFAVLIVLLYYYFAWDSVGRDPKKGVIIPLFRAPKGFSPALVHFIHRMGWKKSGWTAFTAAIISLATRGLIDITTDDKKKTTFKSLEGDDRRLPRGEEVINTYMKSKGTIKVNKTTGPGLLKNRRAFMKAIQSENRNAYFFNNYLYVGIGFALSFLSILGLIATGVLPPGQGVVILAAGMGLSILSMVVGGILSGAGMTRFFVLVWFGVIFANVMGSFARLFSGVEIDQPLIATVSIVILNLVFYFLMRAPTVQGRKIMDEIDGFKLYLETAEVDRLNFSGEPEFSIERFEEILPYAIALGVEKPWTSRLEGEFLRNTIEQPKGGYRPGWHHGSSFSSNSLSSNIAGIATGMSTAMISAQPSSSSSSGGGGGGSSGGGGGGGGGGGW